MRSLLQLCCCFVTTDLSYGRRMSTDTRYAGWLSTGRRQTTSCQNTHTLRQSDQPTQPVLQLAMLPLPPTQSAPTNVLNYTWYCHYAPTRGSTSDALHLLPSLLHPFSLLAHVYFHVHFLSSFPSFNIDRCQLVTPFIIFAFLFSLPPSRNS